MKFVIWLVFLPLILSPQVYKGVALADPTHREDIFKLKAEWSYNWSPTGDVPMLWAGRPSIQISKEFAGNILVLNEPNVAAQSNVSPSEAVKRLAVLRAVYPRARLICCGASVWAGEWMTEFWRLGGRPDAWHMHAYVESWITPAVIKRRLAEMHFLTGGQYWVTEYGSPEGSLADFVEVTEWFESKPWIERIAAYTNRQPKGVEWALGGGVEMVRPDGTLTPIGEWYAGR